MKSARLGEVEIMLSNPDGRPDEIDDAPGESSAPDGAGEAGAVSPRARAVFAAVVIVFLLLPAVAMFLILSSGSDLGNLANSLIDDFSKELSSVGNRL
jgi:hypothetical protein